MSTTVEINEFEADLWNVFKSGNAWVAMSEYTELRTENAKLRELVAELYQCSRQCGCDRCGYKDGCAIFDRMAQLGIEVN